MPKGTMEELFRNIKEIPNNGTMKDSTFVELKKTATLLDRYEIPHSEILSTLKSMYNQFNVEFKT